MKFRDGYWGIKTGVRVYNYLETADVEAGPGKLTVYAACKVAQHRGDTLNAPLLTTVYTSPMPDVIRVRTYHFKGSLNRGPFFDLAADDPSCGRTTESGDSVFFESGATRVRLPKSGPWGAEFLWEGKPLTGVSGKLSGHFTLPDGQVRMAQYLSLSVDERIYGLGERFTHFVKNGQAVDIWNEDGGTSSEQAYKNIPFYLSSRGYGVLAADPGRVSFEVASEVVTAVQFSVPGELLDYYIIGGATLKDVLRNYAALSGRPALPPAWSFGLWLTTSFTTDYDEETVVRFIDGMAERDIPLRVFHFDCFWMREYQWVDFRWDKRRFPEPEAMLARLKAKGLAICLWINPYVAQKSALFDEGMEKGYLVKNPDGSLWQWDRWQAGMGLVDFTNPEATAWYKAALRRLLDLGVDAFKTDFGERIPVNVRYHDGSDPERMHNYYTQLYNKAVFELLEEAKGKNCAAVFARSATVGGQKFPVHWGGDCSATYESMAESLRGGLSLGLSGFGFWSHDIGGFERTATPDLFKRWVAFGLLSSHSRLHGNETYRVPWNFDEEACDVLRFFVKLKCSLMPYLYSQACLTVESGLPMMRPMVLEYPEDPACAYLDRQYFLGDSLLAAPIFHEDGKARYYLPEGRWTNFLSGKTLEGARWKTEHHGYTSLPLMVKAHSVIPVGAEDEKSDYDYVDGVTLHVFALEEGRPAVAIVRKPDGSVAMECNILRQGMRYQAALAAPPSKPWALLLRGVESSTAVEGGKAEATPLGLRVAVPAGTSRVTVVL